MTDALGVAGRGSLTVGWMHEGDQTPLVPLLCLPVHFLSVGHASDHHCKLQVEQLGQCSTHHDLKPPNLKNSGLIQKSVSQASQE